MKIGAFTIVHGRACGTNPVHGVAARAELLDDRLSRMPAPQSTAPDRSDRLVGQVWNIDIEQPRLVADELLLRELQHQVPRLAGSCGQLHPLAIYLRESNGRYAKQKTLHGGTHSARINGVVTHIGAVVDARYHQVRAVAKQAAQSHVHAVSRRAIDITKTVLALVHIKR